MPSLHADNHINPAHTVCSALHWLPALVDERTVWEQEMAKLKRQAAAVQNKYMKVAAEVVNCSRVR